MTATTLTARGVASTEALRNPRAALRTIEAHLRSDSGGRCVTCGSMSPCPQLNLCYAGLVGTNVLPRREPMALLDERPTFNAFGDPT
ncbi:hypothetical protein [Allorhizocola rhizosphaerae]|uniref:hypothetical protein n=1 Tax=Allorhizocola rhizosphaerae TaxID=1872709 RepID=UPI0013C33D34|nr:hypothetical protein [Allorhizocola rhizosphaerae]